MPLESPTSPRAELHVSLVHSEQRYRRLFEAAKDGILILDATGNVVDANPFLMELLGYSLAELVGKKLWEIGPFKDIAASEAAVAELQAKDYIRYENLPLETKDGHRREVEVVSNAYLVEGCRYIQCNIRDITDRKRDEEDRRSLAAALDEQGMDEIYFYEPETLRIMYVNAAGRRNLGYTQDQLREKSIVDIGPEFDASTFHIMVGPLLRHEAARQVFQTTQCRADGTFYPVEVHLQLVERHGKQLFLTVARDITERRRSEQALRESEARYRLLIENSPDAIFIHCENRIVFANPATLVLFGAKRLEEVIGRDVLEIMHPDSRTIMDERIRQVKMGESTPLLDQKLIRLDGTVVEVEAIGIPSVHGEKPAVQLILRDVTEKKQREEQSLRSQRMESLGLLATGIAHDLNNALSPILMVANLLHLKFPAPSEQRLLDIVDESAQHAANMVKQVMTFARGKEDQRSKVDVVAVVEEISTVAQHTFPKSIRLHTELTPDLWTLIGNATQLHQILLNLCVNARDAMPKGGTLSLTVGNCQFDATVGGIAPETATGPYLRFSVADTGTGMTPEVYARIFEPFYTTKPPGKGTGIGLSTVQKIVEAHGGFLHVTSVLGQGTEFQVYLPAQLKPVPTSTKTLLGAPPLGRGELILVVDDEAAIRSILALTLQSCGYRVMVAVDGPQAVVLCAKNPTPTQLLITDMDMPIMDGPATILAIRALAPHVKVIATSGTRALGVDIGAIAAQAFLQKPYSADELLRIVDAVLHPKS